MKRFFETKYIKKFVIFLLSSYYKLYEVRTKNIYIYIYIIDDIMKKIHIYFENVT